MISTGHAWDYRGEGLGVEFTLHGNTAKVVEGGYPPVYKEHPEEACYQAITCQEQIIEHVYDCREIDDLVHVALHRYPTLPIASTRFPES